MHAGHAELVALAAAMPLSPACDAFYFLRHGQTEGNARRIFQSVDVPLSALGLEQAARAARLLAGEPIRSMVCSDILRAHHTARTVAEPHGLQPRVLRGLRERDFGALIGTSSAALDWACVPEGGETLGAFVERTREALSDALADPAPVLVVAHGGSLLVTAALLGVDVDLSVLGNAQPLRFARTATTWAVTPLLPQQEAGADLA